MMTTIWLLIIIIFFEHVFGDYQNVYFTVPFNTLIVNYSITKNETNYIVDRQHGISFITNNNNYLYWVTSKAIMTMSKTDNNPIIFAKTNASIINPISLLMASNDNVYWSIITSIYQNNIETEK